MFRFSTLILPVIIFICLYFYHPNYHEDYQNNNGYKWEQYDPSLFLKFQSISDILDSAKKQYGPQQEISLPYCNMISELIMKRFYHGYSFYNVYDNWIAYLCGKWVWSDLSAIVYPDDIMKHPMAACSQQAIVLMECFKRIGVVYRAVYFVGHYALEANIGGKWYFFDTNVEPNFHNNRESLQSILSEGRLSLIYQGHEPEDVLDKMTSVVGYSDVNFNPAPKAKIFHSITRFLSLFCIAFPFWLLSNAFVNKKLAPQMKNVNTLKPAKEPVCS